MADNNKNKKISFGDYFIADVAFMPSNPVHRVIAVCDGQDNGDPVFSLFSSGYESIKRRVNPFKNLHYFSIVEKIPAMKDKSEKFLAPEKGVSLEY